MADIGMNSAHTLAHVVKAHDPDGKLATFVDVLSQRNPLLEEGYWVEANDFTSHRITKVLSEPAGSLTGVNEFVSYSAGTTTQVVEQLAILEAYSRIDERILDKVRNPSEYRAQYDELTVRGMTKTFHNSVFYGNNVSNIKDIPGLATRYNNVTDWGNVNVIDEGGNGNDCSSIYIVKWGLDGVFFAFPRGGNQTLMADDMGRQLMQNNGNSAYTALVTHFQLQFGLCVADDRAIQRIASVDITTAANGFDADNVIKALNRMPDLDKVVIYVNGDVKTQMDQDAQNKTNVNLTIGEAWGRPTTMFQGIPVRRCDKIKSTEAAI